MAGEFGYGGIVREVLPALFPGAPMGAAYQVQAESLRRLHGPEALTVRSARDPSAAIDRLDRVEDRAAGDSGPRQPRCLEGPGDERLGHERAGAIMDQHEVFIAGATFDQGFEPGPHAVLPGRSARRGRTETRPDGRIEPLDGFGEKLAIVFVDDGDDGADIVAFEEDLERAGNQGPARQGPELLRQADARPGAASCGHDQHMVASGHRSLRLLGCPPFPCFPRRVKRRLPAAGGSARHPCCPSTDD